jgi:Transposase DDE domain
MASDIRLQRRGERILDAIVAKNSLVLRTIGGGRAGEIAAGRYLDSGVVTFEAIVAAAAARTLAAARGRPVLAIQDTTEINFSGRAAKRKGLGPAGDGVSLGFFCHPTLLVDIEDEAVLGLVRADIWTREDAAEAPKAHRHKRAISDKESGRWLDATRAATGIAAVASRVVMVADREGDIYAHFAARPDIVDLIVRSRHDRATVSQTPLFAAPETFALTDVVEIHVPPRGPGDKGRIALASVKAGRVEIVRPKGITTGAPTISLGLVEICELNPPVGTKPVHWRLLTTLPIKTRADIDEVARLYRLRWRIEQMFRSLKSDGLDLEATQVVEAARLFKLAALGLIAATRTMQLVDARDGSSRPATDVIDADDIPAVAAISKTLEGATARQKNHHAQGSLAWLAWVAARLGGWTCYYGPPGPKTMAAGLRRLTEQLAGFRLAQAMHRSAPG